MYTLDTAFQVMSLAKYIHIQFYTPNSLSYTWRARVRGQDAISVENLHRTKWSGSNNIHSLSNPNFLYKLSTYINHLCEIQSMYNYMVEHRQGIANSQNQTKYLHFDGNGDIHQ